MELIHPDTFSFVSHADKSWVERFGDMPRDAEMVYFSLVTLTTVGYGDIVARLVGLELPERLSRGRHH